MKTTPKKLPPVSCKPCAWHVAGGFVYYWEVKIPCAVKEQARAIAAAAKIPQPDLIVDIAMALRKEHGKYKQRGRIRNYIMEAYAVVDALGLGRGRE